MLKKIINFFKHEHIWLHLEKVNVSDTMIKPSYWDMRAGALLEKGYVEQLKKYNSIMHKEQCANCGRIKQTFISEDQNE